ncbi:MAG: cupin domain-containing protein [Acidobacteriota bacterium]
MEAKLLSQLKRFRTEKMSKVNIFETTHCFCDIYCFEPGQQQQLHTHTDADKIYFVLEGKGNFQVGDEQTGLGVGYSVLARAGQPHGVHNDSNEQLVLLVFMAPNPNISAKH